MGDKVSHKSVRKIIMGQEKKTPSSSAKLLSAMSAGLISGTLIIVIAMSFAALIFSKNLSGYVSNGIGFTLYGAFVMGIVVSFTSSFSGSMACPQDAPAAILAVAAAAVFAQASITADPARAFMTTVAMISTCSVLVGLFFILMGLFKLGNLVRYFPFAVIGGFLAGTGWLLFSGGIDLMAGISLNFKTIDTLLDSSVLIKWIPGLAFAVLLFAVMQRFNNVILLPSMLILAAGVFYALLPITGTSIEKVGKMGLLLGPFPSGGLWKPLSISALANIDFGLVFGQIWNICAVAIVSLVALLLNASGLELIVHRDIDLNRELQSAGVANLIAGLGGSPAGYHTLSISALGYRLGAEGRSAGIVSTALCGVALFFGATLLSFFPKPILGGLIVFLGISLLYEWLYESFFKLPLHDYLLIIIILVVIGKYGFLKGVMAGLVIAVGLFVINFSRINTIRNTFSGTDYQSNVDRNPVERQLLKRKGDQIFILKLQSYIFFGTANNIIDHISQRLSRTDMPEMRYVLLDFLLVTGFDSSSLNRLARMIQLAQRSNFTIVFAHVPPELKQPFENYGINEKIEERVCFVEDLDHGIEWCENQIIDREMNLAQEKDKTVLDMQTETFFQSVYEDLFESLELKEMFDTFLSDMADYLVLQNLPDGEVLINQGDTAQGFFFIELGEVTADVKSKDGKTIRLRTMKEGTIVGDMGMYLQCPAVATVVAKGPCTIYHLTGDNLAKLEKEKPDIASAFHRYMARLLCERLSNTNRTLEIYASRL
jgi:SulP family sulfate permease